MFPGFFIPACLTALVASWTAFCRSNGDGSIEVDKVKSRIASHKGSGDINADAQPYSLKFGAVAR